jgi:drug/metabolite transporter (DMT)-like permease
MGRLKLAEGRIGIYFLMLLVPLFWGGAFGATKHVLAEVPPLTISAFRFLIAGALMVGWTVWRNEWDWKPVRESWPGLLILGATGILGYNAFFSIGMQYTTAINGALVVVINPVTTSMVAVLLLGERWSIRLGLGVLLSLTGVLKVITRGDWTTLQSLTLNQGEIWLLGAVVSWTTYTSLAKVVMRNVPATMATTVSTLAGAVMLWLASLSESGWGKLSGVSGQVAAELVYLAVFPSFVAYLIFNMGIKEIGASKASAYINLMPVNAVLIAALFYGETVTLTHGVGMGLVMSGVLLTTRAPSGKIY